MGQQTNYSQISTKQDLCIQIKKNVSILYKYNEKIN